MEPIPEDVEQEQEHEQKPKNNKCNINTSNPNFGWSPISRRYIKRDSVVYRRLVKSGVVDDPEINAMLMKKGISCDKKVPTYKNSNYNKIHLENPVTASDKQLILDKRKDIKKLIAKHIDELTDLPDDEAEDFIKKLMNVSITDKLDKSDKSDKSDKPTKPNKLEKPKKQKKNVMPSKSESDDSDGDNNTSEYSVDESVAPKGKNKYFQSGSMPSKCNSRIKLHLSARPKDHKVKVSDLFSTTECDSGSD